MTHVVRFSILYIKPMAVWQMYEFRASRTWLLWQWSLWYDACMIRFSGGGAGMIVFSVIWRMYDSSFSRGRRYDRLFCDMTHVWFKFQSWAQVRSSFLWYDACMIPVSGVGAAMVVFSVIWRMYDSRFRRGCSYDRHLLHGHHLLQHGHRLVVVLHVRVLAGHAAVVRLFK